MHFGARCARDDACIVRRYFIDFRDRLRRLLWLGGDGAAATRCPAGLRLSGSALPAKRDLQAGRLRTTRRYSLVDPILLRELAQSNLFLPAYGHRIVVESFGYSWEDLWFRSTTRVVVGYYFRLGTGRGLERVNTLHTVDLILCIGAACATLWTRVPLRTCSWMENNPFWNYLNESIISHRRAGVRFD